MSLLWRGGVLLLWFNMIQRQASLLRDSSLLTGKKSNKTITNENVVYIRRLNLCKLHTFIFVFLWCRVVMVSRYGNTVTAACRLG